MKKLLLVGACLVFLNSCKQKDYNVNISTPTYSSMDEVFAKLSLRPKALTVDATTGGSFNGNSGTRYIFSPNSFQTASGATVTGKIDMQVCEYLKKGDMIFSKMLPISNGQPLVSGGQLTISASQNGQPIYLKPGCSFTANMPCVGPPDQNMQLFKGQPVSDTATSKVNWTLGDNLKTIGVFTVNGQDTFRVVADSLKPMNADFFLGFTNAQNCDLKVNLASGTTPANTNLYIYSVLSDIKAIVLLGFGNNQAYYNVRVSNHPMHFVAFTLINGKFYAGMTSATPANGSAYNITLSEKDAVQFMSQLNNL
jgi:hypothetical protein